MALLDSANNILSNAIFGGSSLDRQVSQTKNQQLSFQDNGFNVPGTPSADGNGLPSSKIPSQREHVFKRRIMKFFVPEVGIVNMYVNPQSIKYNFDKLINQEITKGGYVLQYWGEKLTTLNITGNTGSSGLEGINVLYEVYRSEQLTFDSIGLTLAANNSVSGLGDLIDNSLTQQGGLSGTIGSLTNGLFNLNPLSQTILPNKPATLADLAFGIEIYYSGWVFRGYFQSFDFTESTSQLGLFDYNIQFVVTQRRGYRTNYMPWHRSAIDGPSNNDTHGGIPLSFDKKQQTTGQIQTAIVLA